MEGVIGSLRTFLFTETTNRIDLRLGAEVIDHLLRLPLGYFDRRPVGELGTRIAELEKIRNFLTGQALTTLLDAAFSVIYIIVMAALQLAAHDRGPGGAADPGRHHPAGGAPVPPPVPPGGRGERHAPRATWWRCSPASRR